MDLGARIADRDGKARAGGRTPRARLDSALAEIRNLDARAVNQGCPSDDVRAVLAQRILNTAQVLVQIHEQLTKELKS